MKTVFRKTITLLLALVLILSAVPAFAAGKTVKAGFFAYPGYHEQNKGVKSGYGVDFLTLLERYTNLDFEYVGYEKGWDDMQQMLLDGEIDMVTSARKTAEREKIFDFSEPIGTNSAQINVRVNDARFTPGDYAALNGMTIGLIAGNSRNADLAQFAAEQGFTYNKVEYKSAEELEKALQSRQVDAIATSSVRKGVDEKVIAEFAPEDFYVIVKKGNVELLKEINYGIRQMDEKEGNWREDLYYENYIAGAGNVSIKRFLLLHPGFIGIIALLVIALIALAAFVIIRTRTAKLKADQLQKELETQQKVREALDAESVQAKRNVVLINSISGATFTYDLSADDEVTAAHYADSSVNAIGEKTVESPNSWIELLHPDDKAKTEAAFMATIRDHSGQTPYNVNFRMLDRDGKYRWVRSGGNAIRREDGSGEFYGICVDITKQMEERFEAEQKLEAQQVELEQALDIANKEVKRNEFLNEIMSAGKWSFYVNADDEITDSDVSEEANEIICNDVAADGKSWLDIVHPEDREMAAKAFNAAIKDHSGNTPYDVNYRMIGRDGKYRWFHSAGKVLRDESGNGEFFGIHVDITEQIEEQEKKLLGAVPISPDILTKANIGMWAFELDEGQPPRMYGDEAMLKLVGLDHQVPPEEMYHAWYDQIDEASYDLVNDAVSKMMIGEHAEVQYPWHHPDGHIMIVRCGGVRNSEYTKGIRIEGTHQDVSQTLHFDEEERKRQEKQREAELARIKAESSNKAKSEFLFNMSHDIRTPMNAIIGFTDKAMRHSDEPEVVEDSLSKIKTSGTYLLGIINDILDMAKIESGKLELKEEVHRSTAGNNTLVEVFGAAAAKKNIVLHTSSDIKDPYIWIDRNRTNQIITNLLSNAVKYTNPGGEIWYSVKQLPCEREGYGTFEVMVKDTGVGMSPEFLEKIFDAFERDQSASQSGAQGTGLGMAIVKRLADTIGGKIDIQSEVGKGTTVTYTADQRIATPEEIETYNNARNAEIEQMKANLRGSKILLVEDNELNRDIAVDILEDEGLKVDTAEDGSLAVQILKDKGPEYYDAILMDIQMPVMNGFEATKAIREMYPDAQIPIIALSANAFDEDKDASIDAGMNDHVAKPINTKKLFATLAKYI